MAESAGTWTHVAWICTATETLWRIYRCNPYAYTAVDNGTSCVVYDLFHCCVIVCLSPDPLPLSHHDIRLSIAFILGIFHGLFSLRGGHLFGYQKI